MLGYLSATLSVLRSEQFMSFEEMKMSNDKYPSIFWRQMETIVFIILQIFLATRSVLKFGKHLTLNDWSRGEQ